MDAPSLLQHLQTQGLRLRLDPAGLAVEPRDRLTTETRRLIRAHRGELIDLVSRQCADLPADLLALIERIAERFECPPDELRQMIDLAIEKPDMCRDSYTATARAEGLL